MSCRSGLSISNHNKYVNPLIATLTTAAPLPPFHPKLTCILLVQLSLIFSKAIPEFLRPLFLTKYSFSKNSDFVSTSSPCVTHGRAFVTTPFHKSRQGWPISQRNLLQILSGFFYQTYSLQENDQLFTEKQLHWQASVTNEREKWPPVNTCYRPGFSLTTES